jgi:hypothetical protein
LQSIRDTSKFSLIVLYSFHKKLQVIVKLFVPDVFPAVAIEQGGSDDGSASEQMKTEMQDRKAWGVPGLKRREKEE